MTPNTPETYRYAAFISYRHTPEDRAWAGWLLNAVETYTLPKKFADERGLPRRIGRLFRDEDEMPANPDLNDQICQSLIQSKFLIVICSPDTPHSLWVQREIELFREMGKGDRIFALLTRGEPSESYPPALVNIPVETVKPDGSVERSIKHIEPFAPDVRDNGRDSMSLIKRRALVKIVAALVGCAFDDLWQRDYQRELRKKRRTQAIAATLLVTLLGGGAALWDYTRTKTAYFENFTTRWSLPEGRGELGEEQATHHAASYRFESSRGKLRRMVMQNGSGQPAAAIAPDHEAREVFPQSIFPYWSGVARWDIFYDDDGALSRIELYAADGKLLKTENYSKDLKTVQFINSRFSAVGQEQFASLGYGVVTLFHSRSYDKEKSSITQHALAYDKDGYLTERRYQNPFGSPSPDGSESYGSRYSVTPDGLIESEMALDREFKPMRTIYRIAGIRAEYDGARIASYRFLDRDGKEMAWYRSQRGADFSYDAYGNRISYREVPNDDLVILFNFDEKGNVEKRACADSHEKPITCQTSRGRFTSEASYYTQSFDAHGNVSERRHFDVSGNPTYGLLTFPPYSRIQYEHDDQNRLTSVAQFDMQDKPVADGEGVVRKTFEYKDGAEREETETRYGPDDSVIDKTVTVFNRDGQVAELRSYGADNVFISNWRFEYDERGNNIRQGHYDEEGKKRTEVKGFSYTESTYDSIGRLQEEATYNAAGKLVKRNDGARTVYSYDALGGIKKTVRYDENNNVITYGHGVAWVEHEDNKDGQLIQSKRYDVNGALVSRGRAITRFSYDDQNRIVRIDYFDAQGKPALKTSTDDDIYGHALENDGMTGYASKVLLYDTEGNDRVIAFFGTDGRRVLNSRGYSSVRTTYDGDGTEETGNYFYGANGQPIVTREGMAAELISWTKNPHGLGYLKNVVYLNASHKPMPHGRRKCVGYRESTQEIGKEGSIDQETCLNGEAQPIADSRHVTVESHTYDKGCLINSLYFDAEGNRVLDADGIGERKFQTTPRPKCYVTRIEYFGLKGEPVIYDHNNLPRHRVDYTLDENGETIGYVNYDTEGNVVKKVEQPTAPTPQQTSRDEIGEALAQAQKLYDRQPAQALPYLLKAAKRGHAGAQNRVGFMYSRAVGTKPEILEGYAWLAVSVHNGYAPAVKNLAIARRGMPDFLLESAEARARKFIQLYGKK